MGANAYIAICELCWPLYFQGNGRREKARVYTKKTQKTSVMFMVYHPKGLPNLQNWT